jgi:hypothetical protein
MAGWDFATQILAEGYLRRAADASGICPISNGLFLNAQMAAMQIAAESYRSMSGRLRGTKIDRKMEP